MLVDLSVLSVLTLVCLFGISLYTYRTGDLFLVYYYFGSRHAFVLSSRPVLLAGSGKGRLRLQSRRSVSLSVCQSTLSLSVSQSRTGRSLASYSIPAPSPIFPFPPSPSPPLVPSQRPIFCVHQKRRCRATDWRLFSFWLSAAPLHGLKLPLAAARSEPCVPRNH